MDQTNGTPSDLLIAKDIICDIYANRETGIDIGYELNFSPKTTKMINNIIDEVIELKGENLKSILPLPVLNKVKQTDIRIPTHKDIAASRMLNSTEISKLEKEDANITILLPKYKKHIRM